MRGVVYRFTRAPDFIRGVSHNWQYVAQVFSWLSHLTHRYFESWQSHRWIFLPNVFEWTELLGHPTVDVPIAVNASKYHRVLKAVVDGSRSTGSEVRTSAQFNW